jgi:integrase
MLAGHDARPALRGAGALPAGLRRPSLGIRDHARHRALAFLVARASLCPHQEQAPHGTRPHLPAGEEGLEPSLNPVLDVEPLRERPRVDFEVYSPEEVLALVRFAASEQDAAIFLTAAFTGLRRGELIGLRWRDVDFPASVIRVRRAFSYGALTVPKSGKARAVPLAPEVAQALARLSTRPLWTGEEDLVFPGETGDFLDGSALRRRYTVAQQLAGIKALRFHDLRHTFGTRMIAVADIVRVKEWMGHADIETTMRYLHFAPRPEDAALVAKAFRLANDEASFGTWAPALLDDGELPR